MLAFAIASCVLNGLGVVGALTLAWVIFYAVRKSHMDHASALISQYETRALYENILESESCVRMFVITGATTWLNDFDKANDRTEDLLKHSIPLENTDYRIDLKVEIAKRYEELHAVIFHRIRSGFESARELIVVQNVKKTYEEVQRNLVALNELLTLQTTASGKRVLRWQKVSAAVFVFTIASFVSAAAVDAALWFSLR